MAILALASVAIFVSAIKSMGAKNIASWILKICDYFSARNFICDKKFLLY